MRPVGKQRLAQRHEVPSTPIMWKVPRRGRTSRRTHVVEAAVVEVSVMGLAVVAPSRWEPGLGSRVEVYWEDLAGLVLVRRAAKFRGSSDFYVYGVEHCDGRSPLGPALYDRLVVERAAEMAAAAEAAEAARLQAIEDAPKPPSTPSVWVAPMDWATES